MASSAAERVAEPFAGVRVHVIGVSVPCGVLGELPKVLSSLIGLRRFRNRDLEEVILDDGCGWEGKVGIGRQWLLIQYIVCCVN